MSKVEIQQIQWEPLKHLQESHKPKLGKNNIIFVCIIFQAFEQWRTTLESQQQEGG